MWWYIFIGKRRSKWWMFRDVTSSRWSVYYGWAGSIFTSCCAASFDALRIARTRFSLVNTNSKFKIEKLPWPMSDQYKYPTSKLMIQRRKNVFFRYILWVRMIDRKRNWKNKLKKLQNRSKRKVRNQRLRFDCPNLNLAAEASEANASEETTDDQTAAQGIYYKFYNSYV